MRSGCPGGFAAKATMMVAVCESRDLPSKGGPGRRVGALQMKEQEDAAKEAVSPLLARDGVWFETR